MSLSTSQYWLVLPLPRGAGVLVSPWAWAALDPASSARGSLRWSSPSRLVMTGAPCLWCFCRWLAQNLANHCPLLRSIAAVPLSDPSPCHSRRPPRCVKMLQMGGSTHTLCQPQLGNSSTLSHGSMNPSSLKMRYWYLHTGLSLGLGGVSSRFVSPWLLAVVIPLQVGDGRGSVFVVLLSLAHAESCKPSPPATVNRGGPPSGFVSLSLLSSPSLCEDATDRGVYPHSSPTTAGELLDAVAWVDEPFLPEDEVLVPPHLSRLEADATARLVGLYTLSLDHPEVVSRWAQCPRPQNHFVACRWVVSVIFSHGGCAPIAPLLL
jgi:hypothetical protein